MLDSAAATDSGSSGERGGARLESLTALRFVAALLVFGNHIGDAFLPADAPLNRVLQTGFVGVSFFFVLSGFVLTWAWRPSDARGRFYRRRLARVAPNYLVLWCAALVLAGVTGALISKTGVVLSALMLQAWSPRPEVHFAVNPVGWTLSVELFFYAVFPVLVVPLMRLRMGGRRVAVGLCVAASVAWAVAGDALDPGERPWIVYVFPFARLPEFVLGVLLALALRSGDVRRVPLWVAATAVGAAWMIGLALPPAFQVAAVMMVPFALLIVAAAQSDQLHPGHRWLRSPALVRLGMWSFAFYLVHELIIRTATQTFDLDRLSEAGQLIAVAVLLCAAVVASGFIFHAVERPSERSLRGNLP